MSTGVISYSWLFAYSCLIYPDKLRLIWHKYDIIFLIDSRSKLGGIKPSFLFVKKILLLPLLLTLLVGCSGKDKTLIERRDDCADVFSRVITIDEFVKKYEIGFADKKVSSDKTKTQLAVAAFCQFYKNGDYFK